MKVAVTYENGQIFQHFGHTEQFKVYKINEGKVIASSILSSDGNGHGALGDLLKNHGVDTLICGGIGAGAQNKLAEVGITLYGGVTGDADRAVEALLDGSLAFNPNVTCTHHREGHHHGEGHTCGGGHSCH